MEDSLRTPSVDLHVHSNYSHGEGTVSEIAKAAVLKNLSHLAITEHVRSNSLWFDSFLSDIRTVKMVTDVKLVSGIESKVLDFSGELDATEKMIRSVDLVVASVHRIPSIHEMNGELEARELDSKPEDTTRVTDCYLQALGGIASNPDVDVVGHPFHLLRSMGLKKVAIDRKVEMAKLFASSNKAVEINSFYKVPDLEFLKICLREGVKVSIGSDAHRLQNVGNVAWSEQLLKKAGGADQDIINVDAVISKE